MHIKTRTEVVTELPIKAGNKVVTDMHIMPGKVFVKDWILNLVLKL